METVTTSEFPILLEVTTVKCYLFRSDRVSVHRLTIAVLTHQVEFRRRLSVRRNDALPVLASRGYGEV